MCELCDMNASQYDADLCMWLCTSCYGAYNGTVVDIELNEVF